MNSAPHLLNEDRPDFEHVLDDALRTVLDEADSVSGAFLNAEQLRTLALAAADVISAAAADEYDLYRKIRAETREAVRESARDRDTRSFGYAAMGWPTAPDQAPACSPSWPSSRRCSPERRR